ncbi:MAG: hypothetical protein AB1730_08600 [Myxococcota bacterium]
MKARGLSPSTLRKMSVDVTKAPAAPAPYPNVSGPAGSSFTPTAGVERRNSGCFTQGLESRRKLAGVTRSRVRELTRRRGAAGRSGIAREGPVFGTLLAGAAASPIGQTAPSRTCGSDTERALALAAAGKDAAGKDAARLDEADGGIASRARQVRGAPPPAVTAALRAQGR